MFEATRYVPAHVLEHSHDARGHCPRRRRPRAGQGLPRVTVKSIDADGNPVAGAEVHLFQHRGSPNTILDLPSGPHRTDANGVGVSAIAIDYDGGRFDRSLHARVPGRLVGALRFDDSPIAEPLIRSPDPGRPSAGARR